MSSRKIVCEYVWKIGQIRFQLSLLGFGCWCAFVGGCGPSLFEVSVSGGQKRLYGSQYERKMETATSEVIGTTGPAIVVDLYVSPSMGCFLAKRTAGGALDTFCKAFSLDSEEGLEERLVEEGRRLGAEEIVLFSGTRDSLVRALQANLGQHFSNVDVRPHAPVAGPSPTGDAVYEVKLGYAQYQGNFTVIGEGPRSASLALKLVKPSGETTELSAVAQNELSGWHYLWMVPISLTLVLYPLADLGSTSLLHSIAEETVAEAMDKVAALVAQELSTLGVSADRGDSPSVVTISVVVLPAGD